MSLDPVALLQRYHAALNRYDANMVRPMFAPEAVYVSPGVSGRLDGREAVIAAFTAYFAEHPDQHAEDDSVEELDPRTARALWRLTATRASSGERVTRQGVETIRFDPQGLILEVEVEDR